MRIGLTSGTEPPSVVVLKIGGSVLVGRAAYARAAAFLRERVRESPREKLLAIVSAENGLTDSLLGLARECACSPDPRALDLLWSTGELRSVALLVLSLHAREVLAVGLNVHETGLILPEGAGDLAKVELDPGVLLSALAQYPVVVVPGFLARRRSGAIVSLGRGGSDLTAVLLASKLLACRCELIKDVPGYFDKDPHGHADARHLPLLTFEQALAMAEAGCDLIQRQAIEAAARCALPLVVRSLEERSLQSRIGPAESGWNQDLVANAESLDGRAWPAPQFFVASSLERGIGISKEKESTE